MFTINWESIRECTMIGSAMSRIDWQHFYPNRKVKQCKWIRYSFDWKLINIVLFKIRYAVLTICASVISATAYKRERAYKISCEMFAPKINWNSVNTCAPIWMRHFVPMVHFCYRTFFVYILFAYPEIAEPLLFHLIKQFCLLSCCFNENFF